MTETPTQPPAREELCRDVCGERIAPGRKPGTFVHASRVVAACDLDSDHAVVPAKTKEGTG